jgi:hypothetical protein
MIDTREMEAEIARLRAALTASVRCGYAPKPPGLSVVDRLSIQDDGPSIPTDHINLRLSRRLCRG